MITNKYCTGIIVKKEKLSPKPPLKSNSPDVKSFIINSRYKGIKKNNIHKAMFKVLFVILLVLVNTIFIKSPPVEAKRAVIIGVK